MADKIKLPALPEPVYTYDEDGNKVYYEKASLVRARDIEVARVVLEAAAFYFRGACRHLTDLQISDQIRNLKVSHD